VGYLKLLCSYILQLRFQPSPDPIIIAATEMFGKPNFTAADIPDQTGRVILVTGGNSGLGKESILQLAKKNATLYMASRTESKAVRPSPFLCRWYAPATDLSAPLYSSARSKTSSGRFRLRTYTTSRWT